MRQLICIVIIAFLNIFCIVYITTFSRKFNSCKLKSDSELQVEHSLPTKIIAAGLIIVADVCLIGGGFRNQLTTGMMCICYVLTVLGVIMLLVLSCKRISLFQSCVVVGSLLKGIKRFQYCDLDYDAACYGLIIRIKVSDGKMLFASTDRGISTLVRRIRDAS